MPQAPQLDYDTVTRFLKGRLSLEELDKDLDYSNSTRALVALAIVVARPELYLVQPFKDAVLRETLSDLYCEAFPEHYSSIAQTSRIKGLHTATRGGNTPRTVLTVPERLRTLVAKHALDAGISNAVVTIMKRRKIREARTADFEAKHRAQVNRVVDHIEHLMGLNYGETETVVRLVRIALRAEERDFFTEPNAGNMHFGRDFDLEVRLELAARRAKQNNTPSGD